MKVKTYLSLTSSLVALGAVLGAAPALADPANGWTGGSSYWSDYCDDGDGGTFTCPVGGNNYWSDGSNWSGGTPDGQDVNIGLSTYQSGPSDRPMQYDTVVINGGYSATAGRVYIGFSGSRSDSGSFGAGELINDGSLTVVNDIVVGSTGTGTFTNNGVLDLGGSLIIGAGGPGTVIIGDEASTNIDRHLVVGENRTGNLTAASDISVGGNTTIGLASSADGTLELTDGANLTIGGTLTVGENGSGLLLIGEDSVVDTTGAVAAGLGSTSTGNVISVEGEMRNHSTLTLGQHGTATLGIDEDGLVETDGRVILGADTGSSGAVFNEGTVINHDRLIVGDHGYGLFETAGTGATTTTTGNVTLGADKLGVGIVTVEDRGVMNNAGRLDVGDEGEGYLLVASGGKVNNEDAVIGRNGQGYALVTGRNSLWDNRSSLTLGDEDGSKGLLIINDRATVRIDGGAGTLLIAADAGSTGVLNIGAMSPEGEDYGIDPTVKAALNDADTSSSSRAAGTLDAAYVQFGDGQGTVNFKTTSNLFNNYHFQAGFVGEGAINHYAGFTVLDGDSSEFTGAVNVIGGTLVANNVLAGDVIVDAGATLSVGRGGTTGDVVNDIANAGLVVFNRSNRYEFDSVISGSGAVAQIGFGTTVITADQAYTGATTILNGTLQLGDGGTTGSIDATSGVYVGILGTLAFNRSDLVEWDREIRGLGTIEHIGSGITVLTGENDAFFGRTYIDNGILAVTDVLGGRVYVNDGGTLAGTGAVGRTVAREGGAIAPGLGNIGELSVAGSFTQEANSTYRAEVLSSGETDLISATGAASIVDGAELNVTKLDNDRYDLERRYTVLTANGGLAGTYDLTGDTFVSTFYRVEDQYDDNNAYLKVNQHRQFQDAGVTANQIAAATAAQELKGQFEDVPGYETTGHPTNDLFRAIAYLPTDEIAQYAFDQISGEIYASTQVGLIEQSRFVRDASSQRIRDAFGGVGAKGEADDGNGLSGWGHGFGSWSKIDGDGNAGNFTHNTGGFFLGADTPLGDAFRVGVLGGYSHSSFGAEGRGSSASSDNFDLGAYGGGKVDNFGFSLGGNYTWHNVSTDRNVNIPGFGDALSSEYNARTAQIYGNIGYTIDLGNVSFEPFAGLAYVNVDRDGYGESGGAAALSGSGETVSAKFATLGLRGATTFNAGDALVKASGMVGWRHAFDEVNPTATHSFAGGSLFTVGGVPLAQDVAAIEAGLETALSQDLTIGASYSGQFGSGLSDHGLRGDLNWKF